MSKNKENDESKVEKKKRMGGYEPNFTTPEPTKKEMDAWIKKNIESKVEKSRLKRLNNEKKQSK